MRVTRFQENIKSLLLDMINFRCLLVIQEEILSRQLAVSVWLSGERPRWICKLGVHQSIDGIQSDGIRWILPSHSQVCIHWELSPVAPTNLENRGMRKNHAKKIKDGLPARWENQREGYSRNQGGKHFTVQVRSTVADIADRSARWWLRINCSFWDCEGLRGLWLELRWSSGNTDPRNSFKKEQAERWWRQNVQTTLVYEFCWREDGRNEVGNTEKSGGRKMVLVGGWVWRWGYSTVFSGWQERSSTAGLHADAGGRWRAAETLSLNM